MEAAERVLEPGISYDGAEPVRIRVRTRGRRIDLDDDGRAVEKADVAGSRREWLGVAERVVAAEGFNVNRRGVVFVPLVEGRDVAEVAGRLAATSASVYAALLELDDRGGFAK